MFENKYISRLDCHYSRIIMSWVKAGGKFKRYCADFRDWCRTELKLTDAEIQDLVNMATNGKLELETSAEKYLKIWGNGS